MTEAGENPWIRHDGNRHAFTFPADAGAWLSEAGWDLGDGSPARIALARAYQPGPAPLVTADGRAPITIETVDDVHSIVITEHPYPDPAVEAQAVALIRLLESEGCIFQDEWYPEYGVAKLRYTRPGRRWPWEIEVRPWAGWTAQRKGASDA